MADVLQAGKSCFIPEGEIEKLALKLFMRRMGNKNQFSKRTIRYNSDHHSYTKINLCFKNEDDYFLFRGKRQQFRLSRKPFSWFFPQFLGL